jgi:Na+/H+-dicarboxylate symporter
MVGVGTSSSAATMPVTMKCGEDYGCVSSIVRFVVPMGTNVNRDGAALYEAVSVIFIVQVTIVGNSPVLLYCLFVCWLKAEMGLLLDRHTEYLFQSAMSL